ncbi:type IV pilus modification protein PilV [Pseudoalteromonas sp. YIC-656]|uniref:type IV pilus modification protein PilV n=1 Tax=Pseudoalteromonas pernae TaxID=3118054 RepID=UPI003241C3E8
MRKQQGFTLLETLIAFIVLVFGLLGAVALQARAKQATYDSMQRAAALGVAQDIVERIKANPLGAQAGAYNLTISSNDGVGSGFASCINVDCDPGGLAAYDAEQWRRAIRGQENTGALADATVCIEAALAAEQLNIDVTITWASRQELGSSADAGISKQGCGGNTNTRRMLAMESYAYVR